MVSTCPLVLYSDCFFFQIARLVVPVCYAVLCLCLLALLLYTELVLTNEVVCGCCEFVNIQYSNIYNYMYRLTHGFRRYTICSLSVSKQQQLQLTMELLGWQYTRNIYTLGNMSIPWVWSLVLDIYMSPFL